MEKQNIAKVAGTVSAYSVLQFGAGLLAARAGVSPAPALVAGTVWEWFRAREDHRGRAQALQDLMLYVVGYGVGVVGQQGTQAAPQDGK